jgi:uncharacterized protein (UPF0332 family)
MNCLPDDLLTAALQIAKEAKSEAMYRAAVNRAYYASYHCCVAYHAGLKGVGEIRDAKGRHEQLINQLRFPSGKLSDNGKNRSVAIGKYLRLMCDVRVDADYRLDVVLSDSHMQDSISTANTIFSATKVLKGNL